MNILAFDIEATSLEGAFGRLLCCGFARVDRPDEEGYILMNADDAPPADDSHLAVAIRDELEAADIVISWNGILYDVPFINARLAQAGERPCRLRKEAGAVHLDLMYYAGGGSMRLGGRRLARVSEFFRTGHSKTPLTPEVWAKAAAGCTDSLDNIVEHCIADVEVLRELWPHLAPFIRKLTFPLSDVWQALPSIPGKAGR